MPNPLGVGLLVDFAAKMSWPIVRDAGAVCPEKAEPFAVLIYSLLGWSRAARGTQITVKNRDGFTESRSGGF